MSGITLSTIGFTSQIEAEVSAASQRTAGPGGITARSTLYTQVSVQTDLRSTITALDPETVGAIVGSIDASMSGHLPEQRPLMLEGAFDDLGRAMSQGEGAFFFNLRTPGGAGAVGAVSPSEVAAILAGQGPDMGSINGYALTDVLRTAFSQRPKVGQSAVDTAQKLDATEASDDPKVANARVAVTLLESKGHVSSSKRTGAAEPVDEATQRIRSLAGQIPSEVSEKPSTDDNTTATLTIIYVQPTEAVTTEIETMQSVGAETRTGVNLQA